MVEDHSGKPLPSVELRFSRPGAARLVADLETDADGIFRAPGKYFVLATDAEVDKSPESIGKLWNARNRAKEIEVGPNATVNVTLEPGILD